MINGCINKARLELLALVIWAPAPVGVCRSDWGQPPIN